MQQGLAAFGRDGMSAGSRRFLAFDLMAAICCAVLLAASITATVRLSDRAGVGERHLATSVVASAAAMAKSPLTKKHCPRSGARHALPACATNFSVTAHTVEVQGWTPPALVAFQPMPPGDDVSSAQWRSNPPHRPPRSGV